jgi:hypothetical protein
MSPSVQAHRNSRLVLMVAILTLGMLICPEAANAGRSWAPMVNSGPDGPGTGCTALDVAASLVPMAPRVSLTCEIATKIS